MAANHERGITLRRWSSANQITGILLCGMRGQGTACRDRFTHSQEMRGQQEGVCVIMGGSMHKRIGNCVSVCVGVCVCVCVCVVVCVFCVCVCMYTVHEKDVQI
ncbi:hypothetical protein AALO_G00096770 [Alosa alosa]|uniref:Uncharacterized protein n=1 Tax=Alosa alosa TaxID=278164 RepID=A0AAV6GXJ2_9TELE|nr:hypothetical protein AALO_G00096770 [Alosa alosa]